MLGVDGSAPSDASADSANAASARLFAGPGEMRARCRALDWTATPLGPVEGWPQSLRTAVSICLASGFPKLVMWGPELVQLYNDAFVPVLQAKHPAGLGQRARDCWPELWDRIEPMYRSVLKTGVSIFLEDQLFTPERQGEPGRTEEAYFTFSYSAIPDEAHRPAGILATVIETTRHVQARSDRERTLERVNAELRTAAAERERLLAAAERARMEAEDLTTQVRSAEAVFRHALEVASLGAWRLDLVGGGSWRALRHDQIFGYPDGRAEWTYQDFLAHVHPDDRARVDEAFGGALADGGAWDFTCRIRRASDGAERWIAARGEVAADAVGRAERMIGVVRDVTDQQLAERALREARDAAEAARAAAEGANRAKSDFLAVMSHELRTPLNAIGGYAELIELGIHGPVTDAQRTVLARIQASQRHLLGLIAGVLDYSRLEAGAVAYRLSDVPIGEAVAEAEALVAPQLRAKGLGYAWSGAPAGLCVRADREKLQQVLLNLLGNAVKFTDARDGVPGRIEVACAIAVADAGIADGANGGDVELRISDTGVGIAPEKLAGVFEPFVQVDQRLTRPQDGVGLGLAISHDLARGMGGDLTAESVPGVGSTFTLRLPRA